MRKEHARLQEKQQLRGRWAVYFPPIAKKRDGWGTRCFGVGWERDKGNGNKGSGKSNGKGNGGQAGGLHSHPTQKQGWIGHPGFLGWLGGGQGERAKEEGEEERQEQRGEGAG